MKNLIVILFFTMLAGPVMAQTDTLLPGEIEGGWSGGSLFKTGLINGRIGYFVGGQGGWIINHRFVIGGKGYILVNPLEMDGLQNIVLGFGCGGVLFEYIVASNKLIHVSIESMVGAGGVYNDVKDYYDYHDPIDFTGDAFFVFEPGINIILNVTKRLRVGAGATYRFIYGVNFDAGAPYRYPYRTDYDTISDSDLRGLSGQLVLQFGVF